MAPKKKKGKQKAEQSGIDEVEVDGILDEIPPPITIFNLSDPSKLAENYKTSVNDIRSAMEKETDVKYTFVMGNEEVVVPVTPGKDFTRKGAYTIRLTDGDINLDLVADKYQCWFRGIVTNDGRRYEIDDNTPKIMKNSESLHTTGMYPNLLGTRAVADLILGYQQLLSAFYTLARYGEVGKDSSKVKESIALFIVMFFEGPRFVPLDDLVQSVLDQQSSTKVGVGNQGLINDWCNKCMAFYKENLGAEKVVISEGTSDVVKHAAETFRIMCRSKWDAWQEQLKVQVAQAQDSPKHGNKEPKDQRSSGTSKGGGS